MKPWLAYALVSGLLLAGLAPIVSAAFGTSGRALWLAAGVAYAVQLVAFGGLLAARRTAHGFMVGWGGGMLLRFVVVIAFGLWVTRAEPVPAAPALIGLVGFVFVLILLEPVFLRKANDR